MLEKLPQPEVYVREEPTFSIAKPHPAIPELSRRKDLRHVYELLQCVECLKCLFKARQYLTLTLFQGEKCPYLSLIHMS